MPDGMTTPPRIGFACAYTPLPLLDAAGFVPHRLLPVGDWPDEAGSLLHDNLCPHVKRLLDRGLAGDVPALDGVVFMDSCEAMRRLADAWRVVRPTERVELVDLPLTADRAAVTWFAGVLRGLRDRLAEWGGRRVGPEQLLVSLERYTDLARALARLASDTQGRADLQEQVNLAVSRPAEESLAALAERPGFAAAQPASGVPVYVFGNVLPDPQAWRLIEACGARVVGDDLCTGLLQLPAYPLGDGADPFDLLARGLLTRTPCARSLPSSRAGELAEQVVASAREAGARGVIAHVMKFCDPYLARLPIVRDALRDAGLPLLVLEGDATLRSLGQHRTRLEAFVEMLGGGAA